VTTAPTTAPAPQPSNVIPLSRFLRPTSQYALPLASREQTAAPTTEGDTNDD
jgi:hypothetical protein